MDGCDFFKIDRPPVPTRYTHALVHWHWLLLGRMAPVSITTVRCGVAISQSHAQPEREGQPDPSRSTYALPG